MGAGVAVALMRVRAVGSDEDNSRNSNGGGAYNNQLKGPVEETTVAATVTAMDTATVMVKATEKDKNNTGNNNGVSRTATKTTSPGCTSRVETSPLTWHSVSVGMMVRKIEKNKKYTAQLPPVQPIVRLICCHHCRLL
jgi:hypothetical protein